MREKFQDSKQKTDDDKASEVDNGLINGSQEISRNGFDDVNGTAAVRVRFEIDRAAEPWRNGVRCVANGTQSIDDASRVLTKDWNANDNYSKPEERTIAEKRKDWRRTDDAKIDERNANAERDDSGLIEKKPPIVDIVQHLVESR